jgi:nicotinamidase-related amidase
MKKLIIMQVFFVCMFSTLLDGQEKYSVSQLDKAVCPALLVIDLQNDYLPYMAEGDKKTAMDTINRAIGLFREKHLPVIRIYHHDPERGPQPGTEGFEFPKSVAVTESDPRVIKHYQDAFAKTCLDSLLQGLGVNTVFLCGLSATGCVLGTYFGALDHDYLALMLKDGLISPKPEQTEMIRDICRGMSFGSVRNMLNRKH